MININQYLNGTVSKLITERLKKSDILMITNPGYVFTYNGNEFSQRDSNFFKYIIIDGKSTEAIIEQEASFLFFRKTLSVIPN